MNAKQRKLKEQLQTIVTAEPYSLKAAVAREAIAYDTVIGFFSDLLQHGCQSGMIRSLIYYTDTYQFFDDYYLEIEEIRHNLEQSLGDSLKPNGDLKNWYAWLGFEETARQLADEFGIDW